MQERTEWHRIVFYNKLAEIVGQYVKKGSKIYIKGSIRTRKWQDQSGQDRYTTEIIAEDMQMLDKKGEVDLDSVAHYEQQAAMPTGQQSTKPSQIPSTATDDAEHDDIPF